MAWLLAQLKAYDTSVWCDHSPLRWWLGGGREVLALQWVTLCGRVMMALRQVAPRLVNLQVTAHDVEQGLASVTASTTRGNSGGGSGDGAREAGVALLAGVQACVTSANGTKASLLDALSTWAASVADAISQVWNCIDLSVAHTHTHTHTHNTRTHARTHAHTRAH